MEEASNEKCELKGKARGNKIRELALGLHPNHGVGPGRQETSAGHCDIAGSKVSSGVQR